MNSISTKWSKLILANGLPGRPWGSVVKNQTAMQQTQVPYLGQKDPLEEGTATHATMLSGTIPRQRSREGCVYGATRSWTWLKWLGSGSSKGPSWRRRGRRSEPWSGKTPHAAEQLSQGVTTTEPSAQLSGPHAWGLCSATRGAPAMRSRHAARKGSSHSSQLEKAHTEPQRLTAAKSK